MKVDYHIRVPNWGAGTTHKWDKEKYGIRGAGIASFRLKDKMTLRIGDEFYNTSRKAIMDFMKEYPESREIRNGVSIYVVPLQIMEYIKSLRVKKLLDMKKEEKRDKPKQNPQQTLF